MGEGGRLGYHLECGKSGKVEKWVAVLFDIVIKNHQVD